MKTQQIPVKNETSLHQICHVRTTACMWRALGFLINSMLAKQQTNVPVLLSLPMKYLAQTTNEG